MAEIILNRIKSICSDRNITVHKLSVLSGLPESTVRYFMNGEVKCPRIDTIYKIAAGLGMTLSDFFDFPEMNEHIIDDD